MSDLDSAPPVPLPLRQSCDCQFQRSIALMRLCFGLVHELMVDWSSSLGCESVYPAYAFCCCGFAAGLPGAGLLAMPKSYPWTV